MNALRRFIQAELDSRGWQARDLVKVSGLSKQLVSNLVNDDRDVLPQLPRTTTLEALAHAFNVSTAHVTTVAVEALGVPGVNAPAVVHQIEEVDDEVLLRELLRRVVARDDGDPSAATRVTVLRRSADAVRAELGAAEAALADWDDLEASGAVSAEVAEAKEKRAELQADVDRLKTELSRHANGESRTVAES
jgi:transcriptional regulator with XRE-family HTH domain